LRTFITRFSKKLIEIKTLYIKLKNIMQLFTLLCVLLVSSVHGFLPRFSSQIQQLISSKAIASGVVSSVSEELLTDNLLFRELLINHKHTNLDIIYFGLLVFTLVSKEDMKNRFSKWKNVKMFSAIEKNTKVVLFTLMFIFNRNVENAI